MHVTDIYKQRGTVMYPCELMYIVELSKYSSISHSEPVDMSGVRISRRIQGTLAWRYMCVAVSNGWLTGVGYKTDADYSDLNSERFFNVFFGVGICRDRRFADGGRNGLFPMYREVSFSVQSDNVWIWTGREADGRLSTMNNRSLNHNNADMAWLSLIAMVAVHRYFNGFPRQFVVNISRDYLGYSLALSHMFVLDTETDCFTDWFRSYVDDTVSDSMKKQLSYYAWYSIGSSLGISLVWHSVKDKLQYMRMLDIRVGDIVLFYVRKNLQNANHIKEIASCYVAKIVSLRGDKIVLERVLTTRPYYASKALYDGYDEDTKALFAFSLPYEKLNTKRDEYSLLDVGVEHMLFGESCFIVPLEQGCDTVKTAVSPTDTYDLCQNDLIYWIFEDYGYDYDKERFKSKYFSNTVPMRDRYLNGER